MTDTLENPVVKDNSLDSFIEAAGKADRGESFELPSANKTEDRAPVTPEQTESTSNPDTTPESKPDDRPRDELGRFTKREDGTEIPEAERKPVQPEPAKLGGDVAPVGDAKPEGDGKQDSAYVKAQKEAERKERTWQQIEEEKRQVRERAQQLEERERQIQQWQQSARGAEHQRNMGYQPTSQDFTQFAKQCAAKAKEARERGDYDEADRQVGLATEAAEKAIEVRELEETAQIEQSAYHHEQVWNANLRKAMEAEPEILKVMQGGEPTPLSQEVEKVFAESERRGGILNRIPEGGALAIEIGKLRLAAGAVSGLEQQVNKLKEELRIAQGKLSLGGGGPTSPAPAKKSYDQMPANEAMQEIERLAAQAA